MPSQVSLHEALSVGVSIKISGIGSTVQPGMFGLPTIREMHMRVAAHGGNCRR